MQGELFKMSGTAAEAPQASKNQSHETDRFRVTLRLDQLSIVGISALVLYVLIFSFGVEKGKRIALRELEAEKAKREAVSKEPSRPETPAPAVPAPVVSIAAPPEAAGKYTIQVITFMSRPRAEEEVKKLKGKGYSGFIIPAGERFFQVCVERFESMNEAREKLLRLKTEGFAPSDAFIRPLKGQIPL